MNTLEGVFAALGSIEIAADEVTRATQRHPEQAEAVKDGFQYLIPSAALHAVGVPEGLYRAHCAEILDRVAAHAAGTLHGSAGDDYLFPATDAEVAAALSELSLIRELKPEHAELYRRLMVKLFPKMAEAMSESFAPNLTDAAANKLRRDLADKLHLNHRME